MSMFYPLMIYLLICGIIYSICIAFRNPIALLKLITNQPLERDEKDAAVAWFFLLFLGLMIILNV